MSSLNEEEIVVNPSAQKCCVNPFDEEMCVPCNEPSSTQPETQTVIRCFWCRKAIRRVIVMVTFDENFPRP